MHNFYTYKIKEYPNSGVGIYEDKDNWFHVLNDPLKRSFFAVEDIEDSLQVSLILTRSVEHNKKILN